MSGFTFAIPLGRDDLLVRTERDHYIVEEITPARHLKSKLQDCQISSQQQGAAFITTGGFDVLFSLLQSYEAVTSDQKQLGFNVSTRGMESLVEELAQLLNASSQLMDPEDRLSSLNTMKMTLYSFCQLIDLIEADQLQNDPITGGKQKGKKKGKDDDFTWDWDKERLRAVTLLYNLLQLKLSMLFDPPTVEEEVINLIASTCFKILENPTLAHQRTKDTRAGIIQVLGTMNKRYNYTLSCGLKFIQHLKHFEHLVQVLGQATETLVREYGCASLVTSLVREISRVDTRELARDTSGTRSYSLFLVDLAERMPDMMKPNIALLTSHLDGDSYTMRKCVLGVLAEIVAKQLSGEELDDGGKDDRDSFLDCLEDHMHDVNSFVRSHVLHCWSRLCKDKCIPLSRQHRVLELSAGRLQDKSSNVRKAAVQLLTTLLESNPFAAKLQTEELESKLEEEAGKLKQLNPEEAADPVEAWGNMEKTVRAGLDKVEEGEEAEGELVWEGATAEEVAERVAGFLDKKAVSKAVSLTLAARESFPEAEVFRGEEVEERMEQEEDDEAREQEAAGREAELKRLKRIYLQARTLPEPVDSQSQTTSQAAVEELAKQRMLVTYLRDSVKFSKIIQKALPVVAMLLGSKQDTDIKEAIDFFVSAFEFGVQNSMLGVRRMLSLIWSGEATIRDAVVGAYKRLYIERQERGHERAASAITARNLIALVSGCSLGELTSMEKLVSELFASKDITKGVVTVLWEYFTLALPSSDPEKSRNAIQLVGMCGTSEVSVISANINVIVEYGLGDRATMDFRLARNSCEALLKLVPTKLKQDDPNPPNKYSSEHPIFQRILLLLTEGMWREQDPHWMPMAKEALTLIFQLGDGPDTFSGEIMQKVCARIKLEQQALESEVGEELRVPCFLLRRLCFLAGHIALCMLIYLDVSVFTELKRRNWLREQKKEDDAKQKKEKEKKKAKRASLVVRHSALATPKTSSEALEDDDMGCVGAEADDVEAEFIRRICEKELLSPSHLLGSLAPLVIAICANPTRYPDCDLRASASLALAKFMLVSSEFCEKNLQLLFTVLEKAQEPVIRANLIVALGDLSCRFPNTVEPWTPKMYARLHDEVTSVRSNTLTVLAHLILNDMIKVKGQISDMAFCIVDPVDKIAGLSKLFFAELAKKGNTLYNVMPDIVSRLSDSEVGIEEEPFRTVMRYIIGLIEKDKLQESLVEKLCHRFRSTKTERQWRDISYCLSLFTYSDRSIKKLSDNFSCWSDKLHSDAVYTSISVILAGVKKGSGPVGTSREAAKLLVEELEARVETARAKGVEDNTADRRAAEAKGGKKGRKSVGRKRQESSEEEVEEEEEGGQQEEEQEVARKSARTPKPKRKESSPGDEEDEEERPKKKGGKTPSRKKVVESSEEEVEEEVEKPKKKGSKTPSRKKVVESSEEEEEEEEEVVEKPKKGGQKRREEAQVDAEDDDFVQPAPPLARGGRRAGGRRK